MRSGEGGGWERKLWGEVFITAPVPTDPRSSARISLFLIPALVGPTGDGMALASCPRGGLTEKRSHLPVCPNHRAPPGLPWAWDGAPIVSPGALGARPGQGWTCQPALRPSWTIAHSSPIFLTDSTITPFSLTFLAGARRALPLLAPCKQAGEKR